MATLTAMNALNLGLALVLLLHTGPALAVAPGAERDFCRHRGGAVLETGDADVHICCYPARQRCLAVNARSQLSRLIEFPDASSDAQAADTRGEARD